LIETVPQHLEVGIKGALSDNDITLSLCLSVCLSPGASQCMRGAILGTIHHSTSGPTSPVNKDEDTNKEALCLHPLLIVYWLVVMVTGLR